MQIPLDYQVRCAYVSITVREAGNLEIGRMNMTIGDIVKRTTGACHEKGSTGQVIAIDEEKGRVQIKWIAYSDGEIFKAGQRSNTWMSCNALATI